MESNNSALGLITISKLYQENRITDEEREKLKGKHYQTILN
jgi:hypothetical protein